MKKAFILAGTKSHTGKTVVSLLTMAAFKKHNYIVQPFKIGPDYIDPMLHERLTGRSRRNLDVWLMGEEGLKRNFKKGMEGSDIGIIEGVMGFFDGVGRRGFFSTYHISKILSLPVILVVDAWGTLHSVFAEIEGFKSFGRFNLIGVIFNKVGSERHKTDLLKLSEKHGIEVLGLVPRSQELTLPERHLGLILADEVEEDFFKRIYEYSSCIFVDKIKNLVNNLDFHHVEDRAEGEKGGKISIARDKAFSFIYTESIEALKEHGFEVCLFSPLSGESFPGDTNFLYLPGGYPELFAERLMENRMFVEDLKNYTDSNLPLYAECGGLIFLGRGVQFKGKYHKMSGILPYEVHFSGRPIVGYAKGFPLEKNPIFSGKIRGHFFHYSRVLEKESIDKGYRVVFPRGNSIYEGFVRNRIFATYLHTILDPKKISWFDNG